MEELLVPCLERVRRECSRIAFGKTRQLKQTLDEAIAKAKQATPLPKNEHGVPMPPPMRSADSYFGVLKMACESQNQRIVEAALQAIQVLMSHGLLRGTTKVKGFSKSAAPTSEAEGTLSEEEESPRSRARGREELMPLMDHIIETVCECRSSPDEQVQRQVLYVLTTAVTSPFCEVHESSLLAVLQAGYHIHLMAKNANNKQAAKEALSEMIFTIFQRMDDHDQHQDDVEGDIDVRDGLDAEDVATPSKATESKAEASEEEAAEAANGAAGDSSRVDGEGANEANGAEEGEAEGEGERVDEGDEGDDGGLLKASDDTDEDGWVDAQIVATKQASPDLLRGGFGDYMYPAVVKALGYSLPLPPSPPVYEMSKDIPAPQKFPSILHRDAFYAFRAICRHSDADSNANPLSRESKLLSLELLLQMLSSPSEFFRSSDVFVTGIRTFLCVALLKNCTSSDTVVVGLSLRIFIKLMVHFKHQLKKEVEVFVANIFLRLLESANTTFEHKQLVVNEGIAVLCRDDVAMTEIFLNYDCDINGIDLYRRIVSALAKIAKASDDFPDRTPVESLKLRTLALEGLCAILRSLCRSGGLSVKDIVGKEEPTRKEKSPNDADGEQRRSFGRNASTEEPQTKDDAENGHAEPAAAASPAVHVPTRESVGNEAATIETGVAESHLRKQRIQDELQNGIVKFNLKPKKGLQFLEARGHLKLEAGAVAAFLHEHRDRLDKTVIGDFLGNTRDYMDGLAFQTLHSYVARLDFSGMPIDEAIRLFLSGFRLPGEAQKIDRMMEKFAEQYFVQNDNGALPSADTAFVLAFSIIMLQTDLHNPSIREDRKMTKEDFLRNNRGINNGRDLPDEYLGGIYDRIKLNPISLKEDDETRKRGAAGRALYAPDLLNPFGERVTDKKRREAMSKEREDMLRQSEAIIKAKPEDEGSTAYLRHKDVRPEEHVVPMFHVVWGPSLGCFSHLLSTTSEPILVYLVLRGFRLAIRIAGDFELEVARDTLTNALAKFTTLDTVTQMQEKHIDCIKALIDVAINDGNNLHASWELVLRCLSQVARLQLFASGAHTDDAFFSADASALIHADQVQDENALRKIERFFSAGLNGVSQNDLGAKARKKKSGKVERASLGQTHGSAKGLASLFAGPSRAAAVRAVELTNAESLSHMLDDFLLDRVFAHSVKLSAVAIQEFVDALCQISREEIDSSGKSNIRQLEARSDLNQPRVFSLQKLVEVADANMDARPRIVWSAIWRTLTSHFEHAGTQDNSQLSMFTVDSLRQLSIKFLSKDELSHFSFQKLFLLPFQRIMINSRHVQTRELVIACLQSLSLARANSIHSGWTVILATFQQGAQDPDPKVIESAFSALVSVLTRHGEILRRHFRELVSCLLTFAACVTDQNEVASNAFGHLRNLSNFLAEGDLPSALSAALRRASLKRANESLEFSESGADLDEDEEVDDAEDQQDSVGKQFERGSAWEVLPLPAGEGVSVDFSCGHSKMQASQLWALWSGVLVGVLRRVGLEKRREVRDDALSCIRDLLLAHGESFPRAFWDALFSHAMFAPLKMGIRQDAAAVKVWSTFPDSAAPPVMEDSCTWVDTTAARYFLFIAEVFALHINKLDALAALDRLLGAFRSCMIHTGDPAFPLNESLARVAGKVVRLFLRQLPSIQLAIDDEDVAIAVSKRAGDWLCSMLSSAIARAEDWEAAREAVEAIDGAHQARRRLVKNIETPYGRGDIVRFRKDGIQEVRLPFGMLYMPSHDEAQDGDTVESLVRMRQSMCTRLLVSLQCIHMVREMLLDQFMMLAPSQFTCLTDALEGCCSELRAFHDDLALRRLLARHAFLTDAPSRLPNLMVHEALALDTHLMMLLKLCEDPANATREKLVPTASDAERSSGEAKHPAADANGTKLTASESANAAFVAQGHHLAAPPPPLRQQSRNAEEVAVAIGEVGAVANWLFTASTKPPPPPFVQAEDAEGLDGAEARDEQEGRSGPDDGDPLSIRETMVPLHRALGRKRRIRHVPTDVFKEKLRNLVERVVQLYVRRSSQRLEAWGAVASLQGAIADTPGKPLPRPRPQSVRIPRSTAASPSLMRSFSSFMRVSGVGESQNFGKVGTPSRASSEVGEDSAILLQFAAASALYNALDDEVSRLNPVIGQLLSAFGSLSKAQFLEFLPWVYSILCELISVDDSGTRQLVQQLMVENVRSFLPIDVQ